jgi:hypothetical protein
LFQEARDVNLFLSRFLSYLFSVQSGCFWSLQGPLYYNNNFSKENRKIKKGKKLPIDNEHGPGSTVPRRGLPVLFLPPSSAAGRHLQGPASPPASSSGPLPWKRGASKLLLRPPAPLLDCLGADGRSNPFEARFGSSRSQAYFAGILGGFS